MEINIEELHDNILTSLEKEEQETYNQLLSQRYNFLQNEGNTKEIKEKVLLHIQKEKEFIVKKMEGYENFLLDGARSKKTMERYRRY